MGRRNKYREFQVTVSNQCSHCPNTVTDGKSACSACRIRQAEEIAERRANGMCTSAGCDNPPREGKSRCHSCAKKRRAEQRAVKQRVLDHYGEVCHCECGCQICTFEWLTMDHINNDGKHRQIKNNSGSSLYRKIIRLNFPKDMQVLCACCNMAKGNGKKCPGAKYANQQQPKKQQ